MRHQRWHRIWHDRLLSDPDYLALPPAARGILADLRCFAGRTANHGNTGHTVESLVRWYGRNRRAVQSGVILLSECALIEVKTESGLISILRWDKAQETLAAARKRRQRERERERDSHADVTNDVTVEVDVEVEKKEEKKESDQNEGAVEGLLALYAEKVVPPKYDNTRSRAKGHLEKLLRKHSEEALRRAILNYGTACQGTGEQFRRRAGNFFGRDGEWEEYAAKDWKPEAGGQSQDDAEWEAATNRLIDSGELERIECEAQACEAAQGKATA